MGWVCVQLFSTSEYICDLFSLDFLIITKMEPAIPNTKKSTESTMNAVVELLLLLTLVSTNPNTFENYIVIFKMASKLT